MTEKWNRWALKKKKRRILKHANFIQRKPPLEVEFNGSRLPLHSVKKTTKKTASKMKYAQRKPNVAKNIIDIASLITSCWDMKSS